MYVLARGIKCESNKVPTNVSFFSGKSGKVIPNYLCIGYSKAWFIDLKRNFEFFNSVHAITI